METPVAFLIFNRPDTTERVFQAIARAKPRTLLVVCDGPRNDRQEEENRVQETRDIINRVDWPCTLKTNYAQENMGCKNRIVSGLKWIFEEVEEAIILEDDCLPDASFFNFCENLLDRYRNDQRIVSIGGNNFQNGKLRTDHSYYFSKYFHCWGWASWRRVWENFNPDMTNWQDFSDGKGLKAAADAPEEESYWQRIFNLQLEGKTNSWAYPWLFSCWAQNGLNVIPNVNLVSNIGFGQDATHTVGDSRLANIPTKAIEKISHPPLVTRHKEADKYSFSQCFQRPPRLKRLQLKIRKKLFWKRSAA